MLTVHIKWILIKTCTVHFCFSRLLSFSIEWKPSRLLLLIDNDCFYPQWSCANSRSYMIQLPLSLCFSSMKSLWYRVVSSNSSSHALRQTLHPDRNTLRNPGVLIPVLHTDKAECKSQCNAPSSKAYNASVNVVAEKSYVVSKSYFNKCTQTSYHVAFYFARDWKYTQKVTGRNWLL